MFAKGTPLIYINNKKVTDNRELTELKSENIKNVDVITAPGSQYDATVKSVIRIRTRKPAGEGWSVRNDANAKYNTMWAGYDQATIKYRIKGLELSNTSFLYSQVFKENINAGYTLMPKDNIINIDQHFNDAFRQNVLSQTFRLSYDSRATVPMRVPSCRASASTGMWDHATRPTSIIRASSATGASTSMPLTST